MTSDEEIQLVYGFQLKSMKLVVTRARLLLLFNTCNVKFITESGLSRMST